MYLFVSSTCIFYVSFMYLLCISAVYLHKIISHMQDNMVPHISTPTVALACTTGGPHRGGSSRRGALRVWLRAHAPATSDRQPHTDNAHHSAHTCAPGTSSHMRTSGICTALSSAHARQTQQMQCSHSFGDLVFILRSPARAHDLGCSKTPEVD